METYAPAYILASPREGHINEVFHMCAFLKVNHSSLIVFDPNEPKNDLSKVSREYSSTNAYGECKEELPPNIIQERGIDITMRDFVDSDHARNNTTWLSSTEFIIFLNNAPIYWISNKHTSIETS